MEPGGRGRAGRGGGRGGCAGGGPGAAAGAGFALLRAAAGAAGGWDGPGPGPGGGAGGSSPSYSPSGGGGPWQTSGRSGLSRVSPALVGLLGAASPEALLTAVRALGLPCDAETAEGMFRFMLGVSVADSASDGADTCLKATQSSPLSSPVTPRVTRFALEEGLRLGVASASGAHEPCAPAASPGSPGRSPRRGGARWGGGGGGTALSPASDSPVSPGAPPSPLSAQGEHTNFQLRVWLEHLDNRVRLAETLQCAAVPPHALPLEGVALLLRSMGLPRTSVVELSLHCVLRHVRLPQGASSLEASDALRAACLETYGSFKGAPRAGPAVGRRSPPPTVEPVTAEAEVQALLEKIRELEFQLETCTEIASQARQQEADSRADLQRLREEAARERAQRARDADSRVQDLLLIKGRNVELAVELRTALDILRAERTQAAEQARSWEEREAALREGELSAERARRTWLRRTWRLAVGAGCLQERLLGVEVLARAEAVKMRESLAALQSPPGRIAPPPEKPPPQTSPPPQRATPSLSRPSPARARTASDSFWTLDLVKGVVQQGATEAAGAATSPK